MGVTEFMISWVRTRISFCQESVSWRSSSSRISRRAACSVTQQFERVAYSRAADCRLPGYRSSVRSLSRSSEESPAALVKLRLNVCQLFRKGSPNSCGRACSSSGRRRRGACQRLPVLLDAPRLRPDDEQAAGSCSDCLPEQLAYVQRIDQRLPEILQKLRDSERTLLAVTREDDNLQLLLYATTFELLGERYKLVSSRTSATNWIAGNRFLEKLIRV